jgi:hypothetical protein
MGLQDVVFRTHVDSGAHLRAVWKVNGSPGTHPDETDTVGQRGKFMN